MKKNIIFILVILFTHLLNAQKKMYSLSESNEVKKLIISEKNVLYISKTDTIIYKLNKTSTGLEVSNAHFPFSISFKNQNQIEILPFHLMIRTNAELYEYLKVSILEKNEIQKIGMLFYPVNRFYDDCCLYFNHDIFINDWDKDMYASNFKVFSVLQFD